MTPGIFVLLSNPFDLVFQSEGFESYPVTVDFSSDRLFAGFGGDIQNLDYIAGGNYLCGWVRRDRVEELIDKLK